MDTRRPLPKNVQGSHSSKTVWRKSWRRAKLGMEGHRLPQSGKSTFDECTDQSTVIYYADNASNALQLYNKHPAICNAARAAYAVGTAYVSIHIAEIFDRSKPRKSSTTSLYREELELQRRSESRLRTLEEEAVSAALAAAAATAAAAAERARIAAQAALAIQAEQEREAAAALEEARIAREMAIQQEKDAKKPSRQSDIGSLLLSKRRRILKNRGSTRSGSMSQQQQPSLSDMNIQKKDSAAPIHSRPPPPMVSPRFAARLVELVSTPGPNPLPIFMQNRPTQPKRLSVSRSNVGKGSIHHSSPAAGATGSSAQQSTGRPGTSAPTNPRGHRPILSHSSAIHAPSQNGPALQPSTATASFQPSHSFSAPTGHQNATRPTQNSVPSVNHPTVTQAVPQIQPQTTTNHAPQTPLSSSQPVSFSPQPPPTTQRPPAAQQSQQPQIQATTPLSAHPPGSELQLNQPANCLTKPPNFNLPPHNNAMSSNEPLTNQTEQSPQFKTEQSTSLFGTAVSNNSGLPTNQNQSASNQALPNSQVQASRSLHGNFYQPPASHMYGTLPRKNQILPTGQNSNSPSDSQTNSTQMSVTMAMLPNTASIQNQFANRPSSPKQRNLNQHPSSGSRPSIGALLRSGIRSLVRNSESAGALDRRKQEEKSAPWNPTISAPADDSSTAFPDTILPPSDLSDNESTVMYHNNYCVQSTAPWPPPSSWQNSVMIPDFKEPKSHFDVENKQEFNSWQQDTYNFPVDVRTTIMGKISQTILEVDQSSSLGSLPQPYSSVETTSQRIESYWQKSPADQRSWERPPPLPPSPRPGVPGQQPSSTPPNPHPQLNNNPSVTQNWIPPPRLNPMPWQNQSSFEARDRKPCDTNEKRIPNMTDNNRIDVQENQYQQNFCPSFDSGPYPQPFPPPTQQSFPETVMEESSLGEEPQ